MHTYTSVLSIQVVTLPTDLFRKGAKHFHSYTCIQMKATVLCAKLSNQKGDAT